VKHRFVGKASASLLSPESTQGNDDRLTHSQWPKRRS
jgi:hypothetical protein